MTMHTVDSVIRKCFLLLLVSALMPAAHAQAPGGKRAKVAPPVTATKETAAAAPSDLPENVKQFLEKLGQIQRNPGGVQESVVLEVLKTAQDVGQPFAASLAVNQYLGQHLDASPEILMLAARTAAAAGDLRTAVSRYKNYLKQVRTGEEASDAAAELFAIQIDFLGAGEDAYRVMSEQGASLRGSVKGRKFDTWYLDMARNVKDYVAHARRLNMILSDKSTPVELERLICWHHLDWLCGEMGTVRDQQVKALPSFESLAPLIRDDAGRAKRVAFIASVLIFESRGQAVDPEARKANFRKVIDAAKAYVDAAPTAATLMDIYAVFGGGWQTFDFGRLSLDGEAKGEVLVYAFPKLGDTERQSLFAWQMANRRMVEVMAAGSAWNKLAEAMPEWFKGRQAAASLPFDLNSGTREDFQRRAAALDGVTSPRTAVIKAIAAGGKLNDAIDHVVAKESWGLGFGEFYGLVSGDLLKGWCRANGVNPAQVDGMRADAMAYLFRTHAVKTPVILFDREGTRTALFSVWQSVTAEGRDPSDMVAILHSLDWAPIENRNEVFGGVRNEFNRWAAEVKRLNNQGALAKVQALQEAFNAAAGLAEPRLESAPNEVCRKTAEVLLAAAKGNNEGVVAKGQELYAAVKNYRQDRTPFGGALVQYLAGMSGPKLEPFDLQFKIISEQLATYKPETDSDAFALAINAMMGSRRWAWCNSPGQDRERVMKVNGEIAKALIRLMDQGSFSRQLFDLMRSTSRGNGWADSSPSDAAFERVIVDRGRGVNAALKAGLRPWELMHVVRHEYQGLQAKYPVDRYFDDMVAADMKSSKVLDVQYWDYAQDSEKKVSDAAAAVLQGFTRLPFGYGGGPAMDRGQFYLWQARAMDAKAPARDAMIKAVEATYGQTRFDALAMGAGYFERQASVANPAKRQEFVQRLKSYLDRAAATPYRVAPPSMVALADLKAIDSLTPEEADQLARIFTSTSADVWPRDRQFDRLVLAMEASLLAQKKESVLTPLIPHFWRIARDTGIADLERSLVRRAKTLQDSGAQQLAAAYCLASQEIMGGKMADENRQVLQGVRARALASLVRSIPVDKTDRRYPAFEAQMAFLTDRYDEAWEIVETHVELINGLYRDLDPQFCIWIIRRYAQIKRFKEAEDLARSMILWMEQNIKGFDPEVRGNLYVAYADLSMAKKSYPEARAQFERIAATVDLENTVAQRLAEIRIGEVDRLTRNYDKAVEWLEKLAKRQDKFTRVEANYQLALVKFDQAQPKTPGGKPEKSTLKEGKNYVENALMLDPGHAEGVILRGKIQLGLDQLIDATDLQVSPNVDQRILIPGRALTVTLDDRNLSVVGRATEIQVAIWTKNGDRELISLLPSGDVQTKFSGSILSQMAPVSVSNGMLEVYGGDEVYYDFTDDFRKRAKITAAAVTNVITIASDAELYTSSGAIIDRAEQEKRALEAKIKASIAARTKKTFQEEKTVTDVALSTVRSLDQVKPGNPINVRVVDPDRNVSPQKDTIYVRAKATSGDSIERVLLSETDTQSGVFEGVIKSASSEAVAYATDSEEGKDPNFVISAGTHPAWTAEPNNVRPKTFSVDMYDNVALNELNILANVPGRKLRKFILQTSLNGKDYTSVGSVPAMFEAWDGSPRFQVARFAPPPSVAGAPQGAAAQPPVEAVAMREYLEAGFAISGAAMAYGRHANFNIAWDENVGGVGGRLGFGNDQGQGWYVARFVGGFYLPTRETKSFELTHSFTVPEGARAGGTVVGLLDGQPFAVPQAAGGRGGLDPSAPVTASITRQLGKGVHRIEVLLCAQRNFKPTFDLKVDSAEPPYIKPCSAEMFDIKATPEIGTELASKPVDIVGDQDGSRFTAKFDDKSNARILRMIMLDYETDAPAINRMQLTNRDGKQILPTKQDLIAQRNNDILEIVPGDRVTVTYEDPVVVTRGKDVHQAFLTATFFNAVLSASFLEVAYQGTEAVETYVPLRRFAPGDVLTVFVNDPDCDTSSTPDKVTFSMQVFGKKPVDMEAVETKEHSGTFICRIFPVTNAPTKASEVQVVEGDDILLSYLDRENTDPGIPWKRTYLVEQIWYQTPELRVFDVSSQDISTNLPAGAAVKTVADKAVADKNKAAARLKAKDKPAGAAEGGEGATAAGAEDADEKFVVQREIVLKRPVLPDLAKPATVLINGSLIAEIMFPTIAKSPMSTTEVYIQTKAGRKKAGLIKDDKPAAVETKAAAAAPAANATATPAAPAPATPPATEATKTDAPAAEVKPAAPAAQPDAAKPAEETKPAAAQAPAEQKTETTAAATAEPKVETTFDINVPGTIKRVIGPGSGGFAPPPGYAVVRTLAPDLKDADEAQLRRLRKYQAMTDPLGAGIFTLTIPLQLGDIPDKTAIEAEPGSTQLPPLYVHGDDDIYVGYRYTDDKGQTNWMVQTVKLDGDKFFDVMDRSYQDEVESAYVGETLYFRVLDQMRDVSPEKDEIRLDVKTSSGATQQVVLVETLKHAGVFKGSVKLDYASGGVRTQEASFASFPVKYGDTVDLAYARPPTKENPIDHMVTIHKGANGAIMPFSKKFKDQEVAVQTQFTLAEAYFELAKRHRKMGQQDLSRKEIAHGRRLLEEAIRDFPEVEFRVQADYLLANLALEFANDSVNQDLAKEYLREAANRFADIVAKNPESPYAAKSQYKKGLVYEKMGEMDQAAEEYVKLSYKYPENELVAETIARLGQYFLTKGTNQLAVAKAKAEKDAIEGEKLRLEAMETFTTAGQVLGRLAVRFPGHQLAGKTQVLSGQCYMRAEKYLDAAKAFEVVIKKAENHPPDLVAEAMFWCGESYMKMLEASPGTVSLGTGLKAINPTMAAYKMYKQITWDYPASKWAKFARGRLADPKMAAADKAAK